MTSCVRPPRSSTGPAPAARGCCWWVTDTGCRTTWRPVQAPSNNCWRSSEMKFFASCGKGLEYLLADELLALGCAKATATMAGVNVEGSLLDAQRAVLWSRLASRVLWPIAEFDCADEQALYAGVAALPWPQHLADGDTIAVDAHVSG